MNRLASILGIARVFGPRVKSRLRCSFCNRNAAQVERLVAGPSVYICDACIEKCVAVLEQHGGLPPAPPPIRIG